MSCRARYSASEPRSRVRQLRAARRIGIVAVVVDQPRGRHRRGHGRDAAVRQHGDVVDAQREQRRDRAARGRAEADDGRPQPPAEVPGSASQLQGMQHGAVAGELVVHVEHVQAEGAVGGVQWFIASQAIMVSRRSIAELGQLRVLHAVRPAPQHLARPHRGDVVVTRLGQHHDVALGDQLLARAQPAHQRLELLVGDAVAPPYPRSRNIRCAGRASIRLQVPGMDRQPALVLLAPTSQRRRGSTRPYRLRMPAGGHSRDTSC